ncbi:ComZ family protein [Alkalihalobacillus sp. BA299]|uniref:ComZ family protein n=1 Tax=Alkalihalobacillus sp. BA299 TaxID=2815938 RepID=UPI001ADBCFB4|nr:ComZ family protein [Alkalihalobacillus sp. BA299]
MNVNPELQMRFIQIAMKYMPEGKAILDEKGIELNMDDLQPMVNMLVKVMNEAYELGKEENTK